MIPPSSGLFAQALDAVPVIAILRGLGPSDAVALGGAAAAGGVRCVEITMDSPGAVDSIGGLVAAVPTGIVVGAGTVVTLGELDAAVAAGATFVVAPHLDVAIVHAAVERGVAMVPGVATPTEMHAAMAAGAAMAKLFPGAALGVAYLKALRGPYPDVPVMVSGGVTVANVGEWLAAGATAVGLGISALGNDVASVRASAAAVVAAASGWGPRPSPVRPRGPGVEGRRGHS